MSFNQALDLTLEAYIYTLFNILVAPICSLRHTRSSRCGSRLQDRMSKRAYRALRQLSSLRTAENIDVHTQNKNIYSWGERGAHAIATLQSATTCSSAVRLVGWGVF